MEPREATLRPGRERLLCVTGVCVCVCARRKCESGFQSRGQQRRPAPLPGVFVIDLGYCVSFGTFLGLGL